MTPLHVMIMIHYYASNRAYAWHSPEHRRSEAVREYTAQLRELGYLRRYTVGEYESRWGSAPNVAVDDRAQYVATDAGKSYVGRLCAVT